MTPTPFVTVSVVKDPIPSSRNDGDGVSLPFPDQSFHGVTLSFGIRNFPDPQQSLINIHRVLKPGGKAKLIIFKKPPKAVF